MNLVIKTRNFTLTEELNELVHEKLSYLNSFVEPSQPIHVTLETHPKYDKVDVMFKWNGKFIKEERTADSIDYALCHVARKLKQKLEKFAYRRSKKEAIAIEQWGTVYPQYNEEIKEDALEEPAVIKRKSFNMKPMMEEEAILQMEMLGHSFFMFLNGKTNKTCLLYKRNDGNYGLIEALH